ncbi:MAG TPA: right-handed parallel beta-helix repeat-containing protein [Candidatus Krumholzibacteria bacterium]|nr:right-handed parallel beta-helix repeat-containing protein [Candidatus Krumholzibacteria bacterium]
MRSFALLAILPVMLVLAAAPEAPAADRFVYPDGSGTYPTIAAAVSASAAGDAIYLMPGTFTGPGNRDVVVDIPLTIRSNDLLDRAVIDCQGSEAEPHRAFSLNDEPITLGDLVIRGGWATDGGAVDVLFGTPTFDRCTFADNTAGRAGGAVFHAGENQALFSFCVFAGNAAGTQGGAVAADTGVEIRFLSCTLVQNSAPMGSALFFDGNSHCRVNQSIIAFGSGGSAIEDYYGAGLVIGCTDIYGNRGGDWTAAAAGQLGINNNVSVDPLLCDPRGVPANYAVMGASPVSHAFPCGFLGAVYPDAAWPAPVYGVRADGKGMYATIQAAVLAVPDGAGIALEDGTFTGAGNRDVVFQGKTLNVHSASGDPGLCVVDCEGTASYPHVFLALEQQETGVVIEGIGVTGSYWLVGYENRGAIQLGAQGDLIIRNCAFTANAVAVRADGPGSDITLDGCRFVANGLTVTTDAGVALANVDCTITGCSFEDAAGPEVSIWKDGTAVTATISDCTFHESGSPNTSWPTVRILGPATSDGVLDVTVHGSEFVGSSTECLRLSEFDSAVVEDCTFVGSTAIALYAYLTSAGGESIVVRGCTFADNRVGVGSSRLGLIVEDSSFTGNGIGLGVVSGSLDMRDCTFTGNGLQLDDGGAVQVTDAPAAVSGTTFDDNGPADLNGFCVRLYGYSTGLPVSASFADCAFIGNRSSLGGAIHCVWATDLALTDCLLAGNTAQVGAAVYVVETADTRLERCTVHKNVIDGPFLSRAQVHVAAFGKVPEPRLVLTHTLITRGLTSAAVYGEQGATAIATTCDIHANDRGDWDGVLAGQLGLTGNLAMNPLFCDPWDAGAGLNEASVCLPANNDHGVQIGALGLGCTGLADAPDDPALQLPAVFAVPGNHPNPFNPRTAIRFELPEAGPVTVEVYALDGRLVRRLAAGDMFAAGGHEVVWDGTDERGAAQSSGVYLYRVTARGRTLGGKMAMIR